jgi:hypothetical protein
LFVSDLVKWKRALNEIKYKHEELELIKELATGSASEFQLFLEEYCKNNSIDLRSLTPTQKLNKTKPKQGSENKQISEDDTANNDLGMVIAPQLGNKQQIAQPLEEHETKEKDEMKVIFTKLFRKLALNLHPDRIQGLSEQERSERIDLFKKAKLALDNEDYFLLIEMSDRFKIRNPKNYKQQTKWMKKKIKNLNVEISNEKRTYNFMFGNCDTIEEKETLIKNFLFQLFKIRS